MSGIQFLKRHTMTGTNIHHLLKVLYYSAKTDSGYIKKYRHWCNKPYNKYNRKVLLIR